MGQGLIKKLTDKGFGFIKVGDGKDVFFHSSSLQGCSFDDLYEGQPVSFTRTRSKRSVCGKCEAGVVLRQTLTTARQRRNSNGHPNAATGWEIRNFVGSEHEGSSGEAAT